ncbi:hypothetical protein HYZ41_00135 [archaeon]|nr:hypothetical protein [archaeon]
MNKDKNRKGMVQIDFIIATVIFISIFATIVYTVSTYTQTAESTSSIEMLTDQVATILSVSDYGVVPGNWTGQETLYRMGLTTKANRFEIAVINNASFLINSSHSVANLVNELVSFNYTTMGLRNIDINSTEIYSGSSEVQYQIDVDKVTFKTDINANAMKIFQIYFDDDSNFTSRSTSVTGNNNITETIYPIEILKLIQYKQLQALNNSDYATVRDTAGTGEFLLTLTDTTTSETFFTYGAEVPRSGDVVAMQRYVLFQNSTGGIRNGRLLAQAW